MPTIGSPKSLGTEPGNSWRTPRDYRVKVGWSFVCGSPTSLAIQMRLPRPCEQ